MNIKEKIKKSGCRQWEVAEALNINESTLTRWLRRPENLNCESVQRINSAIAEIKNKKWGDKYVKNENNQSNIKIS